MVKNKKSLIAVLVTAIIAIVCSVCAIFSSSHKTTSGDFNGTYNLNAYAAVTCDKMTVAGKTVDIVRTIKLDSTDGNYSLYITVIDTADLAGLNVHLGYGFGESLFFSNCQDEGLTKVVYSSISSGKSSLSVSDFGLDSNTFKQPFFAIVEVAKNSVADLIGSLVVAEKHNLVKVDSQAATCTEYGWKNYYTCSDDGCTKCFTDRWGVKEIADLEAWKAGAGTIKALGHTEVTDAAVEATCTETGLTEGKHCSVCHAVIVEQYEVQAKGHTEVTDAAVESTCTESGLTEGSHCSTCSEIFVAQNVIPALGHTEVTDAAVAATCTETGLTEGKHCSVCHTVLVAQNVIPANGHTEVVDAAVAATCTESGLTEGSHCSTCGEVFVAQSVIPALGHTYLDGYEDEYCTVCHAHNTIVKTVNGVNYTLAYNTTDGVSRYFVASGKAGNFNSLYTGDSAQTLILENAIDGILVTEIGDSAFANTDGNPIKSVIVPKNITYINNLAFLDNYGIERVVFLAENVTIPGTYDESKSGNTTPFYGCSTESGGKSTNMVIYYNTVTYNGSDSDPRWTRFRYHTPTAGFNYRYYVDYDPSGSFDSNGGGSRITSGWDYVTASATVDLSGVTGSTLTEDAANTILAKYYPLVSASTFVLSDTIEASLKVDFAQYNINRSGVTYKCEFTPVLSTVGGYTHVTYSVSYTAAAIINVHSGVAFTYHGTSVAANTTTEVMASVENGSIKLDVPSADGYTFLGFAYADGTALTFGNGEDIAIAGKTVYVIWGHSKTATTTFTAAVNTSGSVPSAPSKGADSEYQIDNKWYDDSWTEITTLTTSNTIVYTRSIFTLKVYLSKKTGQTNNLHVGTSTSATSLGGSTSITINVVEGALNASIDANNKVITIENNNTTTEIYVVEMALKGFSYKETGTKRSISYSFDACLVDGNMVGSGQLTIKVN